jgi:hypothetical protein
MKRISHCPRVRRRSRVKGWPVVAGALLMVLASAAMVGLAAAGPSKEELSADLAQVRQEMAEASAEADGYREGLLKTLALLRIGILKNTEQRSLLRGIQLDYRVDGCLSCQLRPTSSRTSRRTLTRWRLRSPTQRQKRLATAGVGAGPCPLRTRHAPTDASDADTASLPCQTWSSLAAHAGPRRRART